MWITIAFEDGTTRKIRGAFAEADLYSSRLIIKDQDGTIVETFDHVAGFSKLQVAQ
ncbi:hypothetical protein ACSW29_27725 [Rhodococcus sp. GB-02]